MKIFKLDSSNGCYFEIVDLGEMSPFHSVSLVSQILSIKEDAKNLLSFNKNTFLVFSESEKFQISGLAFNVVGLEGRDIFINWALGQCNYLREYIPADRNGNQKLSDVKEWMLAFRKM